MVDVNGAGIAIDTPFGGFKHSGIDVRLENMVFKNFLEVKSVGGWT